MNDMSTKQYSINSYDFVNDYDHQAVIKTGLSEKQVLKEFEKILKKNVAPTIKVKLWRDSK